MKTDVLVERARYRLSGRAGMAVTGACSPVAVAAPRWRPWVFSPATATARTVEQ